MARHDPEARAAERARGGDEVALAQHEHLGACLSRIPAPEEKHDDDEHVAEARTPHHGEDDREDVDVDRQRHIGDPHDERVTQPRQYPAMTPRAVPSAPASTIPRSDVMSEIRVPWMIRLRMSRPSWSAPSGRSATPSASHAGGVSLSPRSVAVGDCGAR